jgi:hypothetical protein
MVREKLPYESWQDMKGKKAVVYFDAMMPQFNKLTT